MLTTASIVTSVWVNQPRTYIHMRLEPPYAYKASIPAVTYVCNKEKHHAAWEWQHCTCWHDSATCRQSPQSTGALAPRAQLSGVGSSTAATSDLPRDTHSCAQISKAKPWPGYHPSNVNMYVLFVMSWGSLGSSRQDDLGINGVHDHACTCDSILQKNGYKSLKTGI